MSVYKCINAVQADLAKVGLAKDQTNTFDNYQFRGIDAVYNVLSPLLAKHGLCILPRMVSRDVQERQSQKGGALFYVTVEAEFDFVSAEDGSKHTVRTFGEAMDRGDKATNKAMSAAYKYAAFQAFAIPTEGDNDADANSHEVRPKAKEKPAPRGPVLPAKQGIGEDTLTDAEKDHLYDLAAVCNDLVAEGRVADADKRIKAEALEIDQELFLANNMNESARAAVKAYRVQMRKQASPVLA